MRRFRPNTQVRMAGATINDKPVMIQAEEISQCGGCLVVTPWGRGDDPTYGITHTLTGASLTGKSGAERDITALAKRARAFWRMLDDRQKKTYKSSGRADVIRENTPHEAIRLIRKLSA